MTTPLTDADLQVVAAAACVPQEHQLLLDVLRSPDDDTPRLIYADFMEESGQAERSEFVRVQVELARVPPEPKQNMLLTGVSLLVPGMAEPLMKHDPHKSRRAELHRRERELREKHGVEWSGVDRSEEFRKGPFANHFVNYDGIYARIGVGGRRVVEWEWSRGFIDRICCSWSDFLRIEGKLLYGGMVECPRCKGHRNWHDALTGDGRCYDCSGSGRIPRPFAATMQPVTDVEITTSAHLDDAEAGTFTGDWFVMPDLSKPGVGHRFDREKCDDASLRDGEQVVHGDVPIRRRPKIGRPLNRWRCETWPRQTFIMPEPSPETHGE